MSLTPKVDTRTGAEYYVEEDPHGKDAHEEGAKLDGGKPDLSLLLMFGRALREVGGVGSYGTEKYTRGGWQSVPDGFNRYTAALLRHLCDEQTGHYDPESNLLHAAHVAWNALARLELLLRSKEESELRQHIMGDQ